MKMAASTGLAWQRIVDGKDGGVGVFVQVADDVGLTGLQRVGEELAAEHGTGREAWVWVWARDMDTEGPAACLSYARPGIGPITEWTDPARVATWYVLREATKRSKAQTVN